MGMSEKWRETTELVNDFRQGFLSSIHATEATAHWSSSSTETAGKVHRALEQRGISCVIGGSLALAVYATPRYTKNIDLNVDIEIGNGLDLTSLHDQKNFLDTLRGQFGDVLEIPANAHLTPLPAPSDALPAFRDEKALVFHAITGGVPLDIFLNTCVVTQRIHSTAREIEGLRFVSAENLAYLKIIMLRDPLKPRNHQDLADLTALLQNGQVNSNLVEQMVISVFGDKSWRLMKWRELLQDVRDICEGM